MKAVQNKSAATPAKTNTPFFNKGGGHALFSEVGTKGKFFNKSNSQNSFIQPKLTIGQPNDKYEQEADAMADKVVQRLASNNTDYTTPEINKIQRTSISLAPASIAQTKCDACENEEKLQKKEEDDDLAKTNEKLQKKPIFESNAEPPDDEKNIQRKCAECDKEEKLQKKSESGLRQTASPNIESSLISSKGLGSPLPQHIRGQMESSFGTDFSGVRIHDDSTAIQMNKDLNAQAFTHGSDVYFNSGKFDANSNSGKHLLAHELTHTIQQKNKNQQIHRKPFGNSIQFNSLPGPTPRAQFSGPFNDEAISQELYGIPSHLIIHETDFTIVSIDSTALLPQWQPFFGKQSNAEDSLTTTQKVNAGLFALAKVLMSNASDSVGVLRTLYNNGIVEIISQRAAMIKQLLPGSVGEQLIADLASADLANVFEYNAMKNILKVSLSPSQAETIARTVSAMRHDLAINVRKVGGSILEKGAEIIDGLRGQGRPEYQSLIDAGKTDAEIILSATKSNEFVNTLPKTMKIAGGVIMIASVGYSIYLVLSADPANRGKVLKEEAGGLAGGLIGAEIATAVCLAAGIATGGFAIIACGLIGGASGGLIGRNPYGFLQMLDIAPHQSEQIQGRMYRLQGTIEEMDLLITSIPTKSAAESDHAVVIATGMISGELISGRGHYRKYQVTSANSSAEKILGTKEAVYVPQFTLFDYSPEDLKHD